MVEVVQVGSIVTELGECPMWSAPEHVLYWEDIHGRAIHRYDPASGSTQTRTLPGRPGSFVFTESPGRFLVAMETDLVWFDWESGTTEVFVHVEDTTRGNRLNDGRCDPAGRYVVGTMHPDSDARRFDGSLYSIDGSGVVDTLENQVGVPNGTVFDPTRNRMYWADTFHSTIWKWDYDLETGMRRNREVFFDYSAHPEVDGVPDGGCLDADGCYWSASVLGWALTRLTPDGAVDRVIQLPVAMPTMPAFGGRDLTTIFVTSIDGGEVDAERSGGVPAGALLALDVGIEGVLETSFVTR